MAETEKAPEAQEEAGAKPRRVNIKTLALLAGVFLIEGVAITAVFLFAGAPAGVKADEDAANLVAENDKLVEVLVLEDRFPNNLSGRTYIYDTQIYLHVRKKFKEMITEKLEGMKALIMGDVAEIFRASEPTELNETSLGTLKRKIRAKLDERLGRDADGNEYVEQVLIPKCTQFRADL